MKKMLHYSRRTFLWYSLVLCCRCRTSHPAPPSHRARPPAPGVTRAPDWWPAPGPATRRHRWWFYLPRTITSWLQHTAVECCSVLHWDVWWGGGRVDGDNINTGGRGHRLGTCHVTVTFPNQSFSCRIVFGWQWIMKFEPRGVAFYEAKLCHGYFTDD